MTRWLVVGAGQAGRCHIAAIERAPGATLAGVVDPAKPDIDRALVITELDDALTSLEVDAVVVATPNDVQVAVAEQALRAGLPVLCEKPVGLNVGDAQALKDLSKHLGVPVGVVLNQRGHAHCRWIKARIDAGDLKPASIRIAGDLQRLTGWHADPLRSGGGALRTIGIHYIDLVMWWLGSLRNIKVTMSGTPIEDTVTVRATAGESCSVVMDIVATRDKAVGPVTCELEANDGRIVLTGHAITAIQGLPDPPLAEDWQSALAFGPGHLTVIEEATRSVHTGSEFPLPLRDALPLLQTIEKMYDAAN